MPAHRSPARPTGRIIVRFDGSIVNAIVGRAESLQPHDDLRSIAQELDYHDLVDLLDNYPGVVASRLVTSASVLQLRDIEKSVEQSQFAPLETLLSYWVFDVRQVSGQVQSLLQDLQVLAHVERAYLERDLGFPAAPTTDLTDEQGYVEENEGVSARWAWDQGYRGQSVGFFNLDMMWNFKHEDLNLANCLGNPPDYLLHGDNYTTRAPEGPSSCGYHGTQVLGIVLGAHGNLGVNGIAPDASPVGLVSRYHYVDGFYGDDYWDVTNAVVAAVMKMQAGYVLLLEVQTVDKFPVEVVEHCFHTIRLASAMGIAVVEPAGNGGHNLDLDLWAEQWGPDYWASEPVRAPGALTPGSPGYLDSGAIVVAGSRSSPYALSPSLVYRRWIGSYDASNYGKRVNCYAWGEGVCTTGGSEIIGENSDPVGDPWSCNRRYTRTFGGTSSASGIIAGVAVLVQEMYRNAVGGALSPAVLRMILSDPANGTDQEASEKAVEPIGVMPDLKRIASRLGLLPDIYIRDRIGDIGEIPNALVYQSPDIFVRNPVNINAQAQYGEGSGTENQMIPNVAVAGNAKYHIYVRMRNRGGAVAPGAIAHVYWSDASSLVAPVDWHHIGDSAAFAVPADGKLYVVGPIEWNTAGGNLPATGHGCFVAVIHAPSDPAPPLLPAVSAAGPVTIGWTEFLTYVGANNNVAWRNFTVADVAEAEGAGFWFVIRGAMDRGLLFDLVIEQRLPGGLRLWLDMPRSLVSLLSRCPERDFARREAPKPDLLSVSPRLQTARFGGVYLGRRARYRCRLRLERRDRVPHDSGIVSVRQLFRGMEVGRLTWSFSSEDH